MRVRGGPERAPALILLAALLLAALLLAACGAKGTPTPVSQAGSSPLAGASTSGAQGTIASLAAPTAPSVATSAIALASAAPSRTPTSSPTRAPVDAVTNLRWVDQASLPPEARHVLALIAAGGPFPYSQDGVVFQNREGVLPSKPKGDYHEYTVPTPGSSDRGARRLVTGGPGEIFYTDDHYVTFRRVVLP